MVVPEYGGCLQKLTENDRRRLKNLADKEMYGETVKYMLERGVKLEQEVVSLQLFGSRGEQ